MKSLHFFLELDQPNPPTREKHTSPSDWIELIGLIELSGSCTPLIKVTKHQLLLILQGHQFCYFSEFRNMILLTRLLGSQQNYHPWVIVHLYCLIYHIWCNIYLSQMHVCWVKFQIQINHFSVLVPFFTIRCSIKFMTKTSKFQLSNFSFLSCFLI